MKLEVYKTDGTKTGEQVELSKDIFEIEPNDHVIYLAVKAFLANQRQGTHKAKERSEVSGGGKKPWKQKGRGGARAGTTRSPLWVGGGSIFGPKPHSYRQKINKKVNALARKSALSYKAKENGIIILEDFNFNAPKTKEFVAIQNNLKINDKKSLFVLSEVNKNIYLSSRNLQGVKVVTASDLTTYDILNASSVVFLEGSLDKIEGVFNN